MGADIHALVGDADDDDRISAPAINAVMLADGEQQYSRLTVSILRSRRVGDASCEKLSINSP